MPWHRALSPFDSSAFHPDKATLSWCAQVLSFCRVNCIVAIFEPTVLVFARLDSLALWLSLHLNTQSSGCRSNSNGFKHQTRGRQSRGRHGSTNPFSSSTHLLPFMRQQTPILYRFCRASLRHRSSDAHAEGRDLFHQGRVFAHTRNSSDLEKAASRFSSSAVLQIC